MKRELPEFEVCSRKGRKRIAGVCGKCVMALMRVPVSKYIPRKHMVGSIVDHLGYLSTSLARHCRYSSKKPIPLVHLITMMQHGGRAPRPVAPVGVVVTH